MVDPTQNQRLDMFIFAAYSLCKVVEGRILGSSSCWAFLISQFASMLLEAIFPSFVTWCDVTFLVCWSNVQMSFLIHSQSLGTKVVEEYEAVHL